jgi:hypothetical protein
VRQYLFPNMLLPAVCNQTCSQLFSLKYDTNIGVIKRLIGKRLLYTQGQAAQSVRTTQAGIFCPAHATHKPSPSAKSPMPFPAHMATMFCPLLAEAVCRKRDQESRVKNQDRKISQARTNHNTNITFSHAALAMLRRPQVQPNHYKFIATGPGCELSFGDFSLAVKEKLHPLTIHNLRYHS